MLENLELLSAEDTKYKVAIILTIFTGVRLGELCTNSNRLFVQANGKPMHPSTISKWFVKYVGKIGLPVINFHDIKIEGN